jgi:hypothetical protein
MGKFLIAAAVLIFFGPIIGRELGLNPFILPFVGIACGLFGVTRHAPVLPHHRGAASPQAEKEAKVLSNYTVEPPPNQETRITDL